MQERGSFVRAMEGPIWIILPAAPAQIVCPIVPEPGPLAVSALRSPLSTGLCFPCVGAGRLPRLLLLVLVPPCGHWG